MTIRSKMLLAAVALLSLACAAFSLALFLTERRALMDGIDEKLRTAVALAEHVVPDGYHDRIEGAHSVSVDRYLDITREYNRLCTRLELQYLWSVLVLPEGIFFTSGTSTSKNADNGDHALFFDEHSNPEAFYAALRSMQPTFSSFHNEWGHGRMLLVPRRDEHGRVYMFGASMSLAEVSHRTSQTLRHAGLISLTVLALGTLVSFLYAQSLSRPLETVTDSLRRFGSAETVQPLDISSGTAEVHSLADTFNRMTQERAQTAQQMLDMQRRLLESEKLTALGRLAGGIAHDFNNLLQVMLANAHFALDRSAASEGLADPLERVIKATNHCAALVAQIIAFCREDATEVGLVDLDRVTRDAAELIAPVLPPGTHLRLDVGEVPGPVLASAVQLHQVVMNLATNAAHAMRDGGGELYIGVHPAPPHELPAERRDSSAQWLCVVVSDTGCGMDPETQRHIFEPYFTTKGKGRGTGLGLATVHAAVARCGGTIEVESKQGAGSTFRVYLPIASDIQQASYSHVDPPRIPADIRGKEGVMLVDDDPDVLQALRLGLEALGYRVDAYPCGRRALDAFRDDPARWDVLVSDEMMPDIPGHELAARALGRRPELPVILATGYADGLGHDEARALGARALLHKPLTVEALAAAIRGALDGGTDRHLL